MEPSGLVQACNGIALHLLLLTKLIRSEYFEDSVSWGICVAADYVSARKLPCTIAYDFVNFIFGHRICLAFQWLSLVSPKSDTL